MNLTVTILIYILEAIFAIGLIGCCFVLVLATIDDVKVLFHREHAAPSALPPTSSQHSHTPAINHPPLHIQAH